jgi:hypothetical protein
VLEAGASWLKGLEPADCLHQWSWVGEALEGEAVRVLTAEVVVEQVQLGGHVDLGRELSPTPKSKVSTAVSWGLSL